VISSSAVPWITTYPHPGWAEQNPDEWWSAFGVACKEACKNIDPSDILGIAVDTTACSVVALDDSFRPVRPALLWMDARSAQQCANILKLGRGDPALKVNCDGNGPLSAEWMIPKSLWLKHEEPDTWKRATFICEKQDYFNYKMTGRFCASSCNVAARWHWNAEEACRSSDSYQGRPISLLEKIDLSDLNDKWPSECVAMGDIVGRLTSQAAAHLGLSAGIPVTQGGPDAYVGMIGLGCIKKNELSLITGSSHLHLAISEHPATADGVWGAYKGAPLLGLCFAEGGQSSTGATVSWAKRLMNDYNGTFNAGSLTYKHLDDEASLVPIGAEGLICLETFQGSRTPVTDPLARGAILG
jgi:ribulose kinase